MLLARADEVMGMRRHRHVQEIAARRYTVPAVGRQQTG